MNKIRVFLKKNYKIVLIISIGLILTGVAAYAESTFKSSDVTYDNKTSKLTSTDLQGAIDELNTKATTKITEAEKKCPDGYICSVGGTKVSSANSNIVEVYAYDQVNSATKCITGEESTCKKTNCTSYSNEGVCPAGTIIKYKVNSSTTKYFHVLHDDGTTMTLQQRESTVYNTNWDTEGSSIRGPITALEALESATSGWTNVNTQNYVMGSQSFIGNNPYTGCDYNSLSCTKNAYSYLCRSARARMITLQEATAVGCNRSDNSCPIWMSNYLYQSTNNGGTVNDDTSDYHNSAYWTMSVAYSSTSFSSGWLVGSIGNVNIDCGITCEKYSARAVVVIDK